MAQRIRDDLTDAHIVIACVDRAVTDLLDDLFWRVGYRDIATVTHTEGITRAVIDGRADLLVLDSALDPPDGSAVIHQLRDSLSPDAYVPVLLLAADFSEDGRRAALGGGAHDFVTKPFIAEEVLHRIRNLLDARFMHTELHRHNDRLAEEIAERTAEERAELARQAEILSRINDIMGGNGLKLVFQPVVDLTNGEVGGAEALSRFLVEPRRTPDVWFAEAAEVGVGVELELLAISYALEGLELLPDDTYVTVNASPGTLQAERFHEMVTSAPNGRVVVELTEHERIDDYDPLSETLGGLRELGVRLAVDDTGAGFASLNHILRLDPDIIKLDRLLISGVDRDPARRALVASMLAFAGEIGAKVVAEGVETIDELRVLRDLGVRWGQGYHMARPGDLPLGPDDLAAIRASVDAPAVLGLT